LRWPGGKVHFKAVLVLSDGQRAVAGVAANRPHVVLPKREHIGGCQGRVPASTKLCLFSAAIFCMMLSARKAERMQTPAGLTGKELTRVMAQLPETCGQKLGNSCCFQCDCGDLVTARLSRRDECLLKNRRTWRENRTKTGGRHRGVPHAAHPGRSCPPNRCRRKDAAALAARARFLGSLPRGTPRSIRQGDWPCAPCGRKGSFGADRGAERH